MMRNLKSVLAGCVALAPLAAFGQNDGPASGDPAQDTIYVTATKRATGVQDVPVKVDVYDDEFIVNNRVQEISDLAASIPNLIAPDGVAGGGVLALRGISSSARAGGAGLEQPLTLFQDGVASGGFDLLLFDVDRVEVIRGPQGAIWGRNTLAGAVSVVTARPSDAPQGYIEVSGGNYDFLNIRAALSGPIAGDRLRGRIAFAHDERDGFTERLGGGTTGTVDRYAVRGSVAYDAADNLSVTLIGQYDDSKFFNTTGEYISGPFSEPPLSAVAGLPGEPGFRRIADIEFFEPSTEEAYSFTGLVEWRLGEFTLSSVTGYRQSDALVNADVDGSSIYILREIVANDTEQFSQEVRVTRDGAFNGFADFMLGFEYLNRDSFDDVFAPEEGGLVLPFLTFDNGVRSLAGFGAADIHLNEWLTINTGFRYGNDKKRNTGTLLVELLPPIFPEPTVVLDIASDERVLSDNQFSPYAGLSVTPSDNVLLYASWGRGNKSGGFNDIRAPEESGAAFGAEVADSYELGLKSDWADGRVTFNASFFWIDYTDLQLRTFLGSTRPVFINAGAAESKGFEADIVFDLTDSFTLYGNLGYLDATFTDFVQPGGADLTGNRLPHAADWSFRVAGDYASRIGELGEFYLYAEASHTGDHFLEFENAPAGLQEAYTLVNGRIGFRFDNGVGVALWARNLGNKDYFTEYQGPELPDIFGGSESVVLAAPRTFGGEVSFNF